MTRVIVIDGKLLDEIFRANLINSTICSVNKLQIRNCFIIFAEYRDFFQLCGLRRSAGREQCRLPSNRAALTGILFVLVRRAGEDPIAVGRIAGYPAPPAQIRTCPIQVFGLRLTANR